MKKPRCVYLLVLLITYLLCTQLVAADNNVAGIFDAIRAGNPTKVRSLLMSGNVDINSRDPQGLTLLMRAVEIGQADVVRELLDRGAEVNATIAFYGITALKLAERDNNTEIIQILLAAGARPDIQDNRDGRPIVSTRLE